MRILIAIAILVLAVQSSSAQAIWRNYWTTNQNPQITADLLRANFNPAYTIAMVDGDSKAGGLYSTLTNFTWWRSLARITNAAVGGSALWQLTNSWATGNKFFSTNLVNGTNGIYVLWTLHNDTLGAPALSAGILDAHLAEVVSSNWFPIVITVQPRAFDGTPDQWENVKLFYPILNNYIRSSKWAWRVVDAAALLPNCYDTTFYGADAVHLNTTGYSNIAHAVQQQIYSPVKTTHPQQWSYTHGTNLISVVPQGPTNALPVLQANSHGVILKSYPMVQTNGQVLASFTLGQFQRTNTAAAITITTLTGPSGWDVSGDSFPGVLIISNSAASPVLVTWPEEWINNLGYVSAYCTNAECMAISVNCLPGVMTNAAIVRMRKGAAGVAL